MQASQTSRHTADMSAHAAKVYAPIDSGIDMEALIDKSTI
jgi:hypothetical protein